MNEVNKSYKVTRAESASAAIPLVFDSPHSSSNFPTTKPSVDAAEVAVNATSEQLKTGWDAFVDELWQAVPEHGGSLIAAQFSRMYIDPNRGPTDIDPELLAEPWPGGSAPTKYSNRGMGLIRRYALPNVPMYNQPLSVAEVQHRIEHYYGPYHQCVKAELDAMHQRFGGVWHVDCHSMKSRGNAMNIDAGLARPDVVLGDCMGKSADPKFTSMVAEEFDKRGYRVALNDPYQGGYLVSHYGNPAENRHSIQIELNRGLYMNEQAFTRSHKFSALQQDLTDISGAIAAYVKDQLQ